MERGEPGSSSVITTRSCSNITARRSSSGEENGTNLPNTLTREPYDSCVNFIAGCYDKAAQLLPAVRTSSEKNRGTSAAALSFKARLLLYAASPLVNGNSEFYSNFKNPDGTP